MSRASISIMKEWIELHRKGICPICKNKHIGLEIICEICKLNSKR